MPVCNKVEQNYGSIYESISSHKKIADSAAELGLLIWPSYPPIISGVPIDELLSWVTHMRRARIEDVIQHAGLRGFERLMHLTEAQRKYISDYLCSINEYRKAGRGHKV